MSSEPPDASLPDDRLLCRVAPPRDTPALASGEWRAFRDALVPHGVFPLLAYRLRSWPAEVTDYLNRLFLYPAARSMRGGPGFGPRSPSGPRTADRRQGCGGRALPMPGLDGGHRPALF